MQNIIFIAPPAAGKGTVSDYLVKNYNYKHLSTGDLLREEIASGSEFGKEIKSIISVGNLVSDEIIISLVENKIKSFNLDEPFILDGFPRTLNQANKLNEMLISRGVTNNVAIYLDIPYDLALKRVLGRVSCSKCKKSFNLYFEEMKPKSDGLCDDCLIELTTREDDNEESFKTRFDTYLDNASSIIDYYKEKHMLREVIVDNDISRVLEEIIKEAKND